MIRKRRGKFNRGKMRKIGEAGGGRKGDLQNRVCVNCLRRGNKTTPNRGGGEEKGKYSIKRSLYKTRRKGEEKTLNDDGLRRVFPLCAKPSELPPRPPLALLLFRFPLSFLVDYSSSAPFLFSSVVPLSLPLSFLFGYSSSTSSFLSFCCYPCSASPFALAVTLVALCSASGFFYYGSRAAKNIVNKCKISFFFFFTSNLT